MDAGGVEGSHSCVLALSSRISWQSANSSCVALGNRSHLLSSKQVGSADALRLCVVVWVCVERS